MTLPIGDPIDVLYREHLPGCPECQAEVIAGIRLQYESGQTPAQIANIRGIPIVLVSHIVGEGDDGTT